MKFVELIFRIFIERTFYMTMLNHHMKICHKYANDETKHDKFDYHYERFYAIDEKIEKKQKRIEELLRHIKG